MAVITGLANINELKSLAYDVFDTTFVPLTRQASGNPDDDDSLIRGVSRKVGELLQNPGSGGTPTTLTNNRVVLETRDDNNLETLTITGSSLLDDQASQVTGLDLAGRDFDSNGKMVGQYAVNVDLLAMGSNRTSFDLSAIKFFEDRTERFDGGSSESLTNLKFAGRYTVTADSIAGRVDSIAGSFKDSETSDTSKDGQNTSGKFAVAFDGFNFVTDGAGFRVASGAVKSLKLSINSTQTLNGQTEKSLMTFDTKGVAVDFTGFTGTSREDLTETLLARLLGGNDVISGTAAGDVLAGFAGNDQIAGGKGVDTLTGGTGNDTFVFKKGDASQGDRITDFASGDAITLGVKAKMLSGSLTGVKNQVASTVGDGATVVRVDYDGNGIADETITLVGVHELSINAKGKLIELAG